MIDLVNQSWSWTGIEPEEIIDENDFGNLLIKDVHDRFWRICPEDVYCKVIADSISEYNELIETEAFVEDWNMTTLLNEVIELLGELKPGYKYHMSIPGVVGGEYIASNFKMVPVKDMMLYSGDLGLQIRDLPDGSDIDFRIIEA